MRFEPQRSGRAAWIKTELMPPRRFITVTMQLAMMSPA
jgi:hypothetical protein